MRTEREMRDTLLRTWEAIPEGERTPQLEGSWYAEARRAAQALAGEYNVPLHRVAGIIAALSPRIQWASNLRGAEAILHRAAYPEVFGPGGTLEGLGRSVPGFPRNVHKAERIAAGEAPEAVLGGDKVRAFYRAILGDRDAAVVDVWMIRAVGEDVHKTFTGPRYARIAEALRQAAELAGIDVADFQAIVWVHVRGGAA
jgi:hypothetical protein